MLEFKKIAKDFGIWDFIEFWEISGEKKENLDMIERFKRDSDFILPLKDYKKYKPSDFDVWGESQVDKLYGELRKIRWDIIEKIKKDDKVKYYIRFIDCTEHRDGVLYESCSIV